MKKKNRRVCLIYGKRYFEVVEFRELAEKVEDAISKGRSVEIHRLEPDWE